MVEGIERLVRRDGEGGRLSGCCYRFW